MQSAPDSTPLGLYDGLSGAALALFRLSDPLYLKVIDRILEKPEPEAMNLFSGRTGLAHLLFEIGEAHQGLAMAEAVHDQASEAGDGSPGGLMNGQSGAAVLFARCRRLTGDDFWRDAHLAAVDRALEAKRHPDQRDLGTGTAGIALALLSGLDWLSERHRETLGHHVADIDVEVMPHGGLIGGHTGLSYAFAQAARAFPELSARADAHLRRVGRYLGSPGLSSTALIGRQSARWFSAVGLWRLVAAGVR
ncbi:glycoside hydrolase family protein [Goodfellowiella coeruleoviolacea]|uniref:Lanthionine synthetase C family protein n=1 Tax=Goodfellowiella coeruleoviolacea TaxID=334858 RepID=A0AAE3GI57_9PSEU|nr:hypothetical protein [Goodfellowiella coeruleoviolacea]MCP2167880.1 hypothetical protein [Goodfellowiella coeruleoviolacea]